MSDIYCYDHIVRIIVAMGYKSRVFSLLSQCCLSWRSVGLT